jgi:hypothetical protein
MQGGNGGVNPHFARLLTPLISYVASSFRILELCEAAQYELRVAAATQVFTGAARRYWQASL